MRTLIFACLAALACCADYTYYSYDSYYGETDICTYSSYYSYTDCQYDSYWEYDPDGASVVAVVGAIYLVNLLVPIFILAFLCISVTTAICCVFKVHKKNSAEFKEIKRNKHKMKDYIRKIDPHH